MKIYLEGNTARYLYKAPDGSIAFTVSRVVNEYGVAHYSTKPPRPRAPWPMFRSERLKELRPGKLVYICPDEATTVLLEGAGLHAVGVRHARPDCSDFEPMAPFRDVCILMDTPQHGGRRFLTDCCAALGEYPPLPKIYACQLPVPEGELLEGAIMDIEEDKLAAVLAAHTEPVEICYR